jgi:hypothetical protein
VYRPRFFDFGAGRMPSFPGIWRRTFGFSDGERAHGGQLNQCPDIPSRALRGVRRIVDGRRPNDETAMSMVRRHMSGLFSPAS